jgi:hypothetical protein
MDKIKRDLGDMREKDRDGLECGVGGCDLDSFIHFSFVHFPCNLVLPRIFFFVLLFCWLHILRLDSLIVTEEAQKQVVTLHLGLVYYCNLVRV